MTRTLVIELPLPHRVLHPNGRTRSYRWRAALVKEARQLAGMVALSQVNRIAGWRPMQRARVHATFTFADRRVRDCDGLITWLKSYADGLADAKVIANDSGFTWLPPAQALGRKAGVVLRIEEVA